jgi:hypothetical protein
MESLCPEKVFFLGLAERPTEAPANSLEKRFFRAQLAMESGIGFWK